MTRVLVLEHTDLPREGLICDNYLVTSDGHGDCMHETPKKIFEV